MLVLEVLDFLLKDTLRRCHEDVGKDLKLLLILPYFLQNEWKKVLSVGGRSIRISPVPFCCAFHYSGILPRACKIALI